MATLFNTKISQTYQGLFKTIDNAILTAAFKELTDGSGNQSGLFLNTAGDFKVTAILEWGSLKDTGTGVTITQFVTAANGIGNFNNDTTVPTSAAVKLYVDTKFSQTDTLTEVLGFGNTTSGKDIAVSAGDDITFTDSSKILMGVGSDLEIYHDGSNSYIKDAGAGSLFINADELIFKSSSNTETKARFITNGAVELYYDDVKRFETTTDGSKVTGNLVVTGTITGAGGSFLRLDGGIMTGNTIHNDNVKSIYGTASDGLEIFHSGTNSFIKDTGTGTLNIQGSTQVLIGGANGQIGVQYIEGVDVKLRHANVTKLSTASFGVIVTGSLSTTSNVTVGANATFVDNGKAIFGAGSDLQIYHDGSNSYIQESGTGNLYLKATSLILSNSAGSNYLIGNSGDSVNIYFDGSEKFRTLTDGAKVTGNLEVTGTITGAGGSFLPLIGGTMTGNTIHNDNVKSIYGTGSDLEIFSDGSDGYVKSTVDDLVLQSADDIFIYTDGGADSIIARGGSGVELYFNTAKKFETTNTGIAVTGNVVPTGSVNIPDFQFLTLGNSNDFTFLHNGSGSVIKNFTGALSIEQAAVTESIIFKTSNNFALDTTALTISRNGDLLTGRNVTIAGDLTVNGTTTTVNSQTLAVVDPLIQLAKSNTANSLDIGFYGDYNDGTGRFLGLFSDASDSNKFKLFKGTTVEPTTTVNIGGSGYVAADLVVAGLGATTGTFSGAISTTYVTSGGFSDGFITWNAAQFNRAGAAIEFQYLGTSGSTLRIGGGGSKPTTFNANTGNATFAGSISAAGNIDTTGTLSLKSDSAYFRIKRANNTDVGYITDSGTWGDSGADFSIGASSSNLKFYTNNSTTVKLTLDASGNATFAGQVGIGVSPTSKLHIQGTNSANGGIKIQNSGGNPYAIYSDNNDLLFTNGNGSTTALTIAFSGNSTFAGSVGVGGNAASGGYMVDITPTGGNIIRSTRGTSVFGSYQSNNSDVYLGTISNNTFKIITNDTTAITVSNSQNAIFAGTINSGAINSTGAIRAEGIVSIFDSSKILQLKNVDGTFSLRNGNSGITPLSISEAGNSAFAGNVAINGSTGTPTLSVVNSSAGGNNEIFQRWQYVPGNTGFRLDLTQRETAGLVKYAFDLVNNGTAYNNNLVLDRGNVGIGVDPIYKLDVRGERFRLNPNSSGLVLTEMQNGTGSFYFGIDNTSGSSFGGANSARTIFSQGAFPMAFWTNNAERMSITSAGKVGINGEQPQDTLQVYSAVNTGITISSTAGYLANSGARLSFRSGNAEELAGIKGSFEQSNQGNYGNLTFLTRTTDALGLEEKMRITSAGNVLIGTSSTNPTSGVSILDVNAGAYILTDHLNGTSSGTAFAIFRYNQSQIGSITQNGTSAVQFNTSSDYRLKEDLQDFAGLDMVSKIPVYDFKWKADESRSYGVMAHELQEVLPDAVSGDKDAEEMQGVDYSKIVPLLVKSIQELTAKVERLEAK